MKWNPLKKYDSWTFDRIIRHFAYWGLWTTFFITLNFLVQCSRSVSQWFQFEMSVLPVKIGCAYIIAYVLMPKFLYTKKYIAFILTTCLNLTIFGYLLFIVYKHLVYSRIMHYDDLDYFDLEFFYKSLELVYITALVVCIKFFTNYLHQEKVNSTLKQEKTNAELKFLKNQIQPHFLFNTLNNLYGMVLSKDQQAPNAIVKLSDMLGYMLYDSSTETVLLKDEIDNLQNYISLEQIRYDRKLELNVSIGEIPEDVEIAPMLLIPFVENAFKHGPAKEEGESQIDINIQYNRGLLTFKVDNTFVEDAAEEELKSGIGLANVKKRLELIYPDRHTLHIEKGDVFSVDLQLTV